MTSVQCTFLYGFLQLQSGWQNERKLIIIIEMYISVSSFLNKKEFSEICIFIIAHPLKQTINKNVPGSSYATLTNSFV